MDVEYRDSVFEKKIQYTASVCTEQLVYNTPVQ